MDLKAAMEGLTTLTTSGRSRSKTAWLRAMWDQVEDAFAAGITHATVLDSLNQHGLDMTLGTFEVTIRRLRAQKAKRASVTSSPPPAPSPALLPRVPASPKPPQGSLDPADLDAIFRSQPDMNAYAKIGRERLKKK